MRLLGSGWQRVAACESECERARLGDGCAADGEARRHGHGHLCNGGDGVVADGDHTVADTQRGQVCAGQVARIRMVAPSVGGLAVGDARLIGAADGDGSAGGNRATAESCAGCDAGHGSCSTTTARSGPCPLIVAVIHQAFANLAGCRYNVADVGRIDAVEQRIEVGTPSATASRTVPEG